MPGTNFLNMTDLNVRNGPVKYVFDIMGYEDVRWSRSRV